MDASAIPLPPDIDASSPDSDLDDGIQSSEGAAAGSGAEEVVQNGLTKAEIRARKRAKAAEIAEMKEAEDAADAEAYLRSPLGSTSSFTFECKPTRQSNHVLYLGDGANDETAFGFRKRSRGTKVLEVASEQKTKQARLSPILKVENNVKIDKLKGGSGTIGAVPSAATNSATFSRQASPLPNPADRSRELRHQSGLTNTALDPSPLEAGLLAALREIQSLRQVISHLEQGSAGSIEDYVPPGPTAKGKDGTCGAGAELRKLQDDNQALRVERIVLQSKLADAREARRQAEQALLSVGSADKGQGDLEVARKELEKVVAAKTSLKKRFEEQKKRNVELQAEKDALEERLDEAVQAGQRRKEEVAALNLALSKAKKKTDNSSNAHTAKEIEALRATTASLKQSRDDHKAQAAKDRQALAALKKLDSTPAAEKLARCEEDLADANNNLKKAVSAGDSWKAQLAKLQSQYDKAMNKAARDTAAHALFATTHLGCDKDLVDLKSRLKQAVTAGEGWKAQMAMYRSRYDKELNRANVLVGVHDSIKKLLEEAEKATSPGGDES